MKITLLLIIMFFVTGCGQHVHTLKQYSKEQDLIARQVETAKKKFNLLVEDIKEEKLEKGISKKRFMRIYGDPVIEIEENELLYRDPLEFFDTPKVYIYFDEKGKLIKWVYEEPEQK